MAKGSFGAVAKFDLVEVGMFISKFTIFCLICHLVGYFVIPNKLRNVAR